jgi:DNA-binding MarR family transcriptional regulator
VQELQELDAVTDAVLLASRVLVAVAARSLGGLTDDVTLPQYRAMVVLASRGPQLLGALAEHLSVNPSTASRLTDRLVRTSLVTRTVPENNRREVEVSLTENGRRIIDTVTARRRAEIARIISAVPAEQQQHLVEGLQAFGAAAGEVPEQAWSLGWA